MGGWIYRVTFSSPRHQLQVNSQLHAPAVLPPGKEPCYSLDRCLGGPQSGSARHEEVDTNSDPSVVQLVSSRYTDWAIPANFSKIVESIIHDQLSFCFKFKLHPSHLGFIKSKSTETNLLTYLTLSLFLSVHTGRPIQFILISAKLRTSVILDSLIDINLFWSYSLSGFSVVFTFRKSCSTLSLLPDVP
jgi:hypothetical protein